MENAILGPYSGPPPVPKFRPVLPEGLGNNLSGNAGGYTPSLPTGADGARSQDTSGHTMTMITETLVSNKNDATDEYEYAPLFVYSGINESTRPPHDVYSLWHLNSVLKEETIKKQTRAPRKTNRSNVLDEEFPTELVDFCRKIKFAGFQIASIQQHPQGNRENFTTHKRVFTVQFQGRLHNYPNIWGSDIHVGDTVAFAVKYVNMSSQQSMRAWDGSSLVDRMGPAQVLQVVPVICRGAPMATTAKTDFSYDINKHDCSSRKSHVIQFGDKQHVVELLTPSVIIPVGIIQKKMGFPSEHDVKTAISTARGYENLRKMRREVDIQLMPLGKRLKWGSV